MGDNPLAIATKLHDLAIMGERESLNACPIARKVAKDLEALGVPGCNVEVEPDCISVYYQGGATTTNTSPIFTIDASEELKDFINGFDQGDYPWLEEKVPETEHELAACQ